MTVKGFAKECRIELPKNLDKRVLRIPVTSSYSPIYLGRFYGHQLRIDISYMVIMFGTKDDTQMVFFHEIAHACNYFKGKYRRNHGS